ncbi:methionyl-tRNA formyltransferase [Gordonia insulae]|uniref:Methionyl-tRNA formyltransferase n=1 Tax=Gordonia insulae TaxID=2420509 RepID=A0A3G8JJB0_9ACTN|nr:methionyl-tRNA formyltransferase [Gordonia insulae]AZG44290.1 Methionyl-tRNA formyltransferase [Gordonia insulae]
MRVVFAGTPEVAVSSLQLLLDSARHEVVGVVSRPDAASGRGRSLVRSPVAALADEHQIDVITPRRLTDPGVLDRLRSWRPDCGAVVAYGGLVPPGLLDLPTHGWVNLHFSVLPAWRGAAPVQHAIAGGDEITGATTFRLEEGLDTGPVYGVITETITATDTSGDLLGRLSESGAHLLLSTLDGIESGELTPVAQSGAGVSHAPKVDVDDARIRWELPAHIVDRRIRAHTPAPGAWTTLDDARIKVGPVTPVTDAVDEDGVNPAPGELRVAKRTVDVGTATGPVRLSWVQPPGKKAMPAADWARGARLTDGMVVR